MFEQESRDIKRKRRLADILQQQSMSPTQGGMVGNHYVKSNPMQHLAKLVAAYQSNKQSEGADTAESDLMGKRRQALAGVLSGDPGKTFQDKTSYFGKVHELDPDLAGAVGPSLFREEKPNEGKFKIFQQPQPDGTTRPLRLNIETGEVTGAGESYTPPPKPQSAKDATAAQVKLTTIKAAKDQLGKVRENFRKLKGTFSAGKGGAILPTEDGESFDKSVDTFRGLLQGVTKVPGLGSMSDFDAKLDQAKIPDRGQYESVTEQQINDLEQLINTMEQGYMSAIGDTAPGAQPQSTQVPGSGIKFLGFEQ